MPSTISTSTYSNFTGIVNSIGGLEVQADQYKIKLADWMNCPSCNTHEGKAKITELSNKISDVQARIEKISASKSNVRPAANNDAPASAIQINNAAATNSASSSTTATLGNHLNVFA